MGGAFRRRISDDRPSGRWRSSEVDVRRPSSGKPATGTATAAAGASLPPRYKSQCRTCIDAEWLGIPVDIEISTVSK